jgi:hypothetical protein
MGEIITLLIDPMDEDQYWGKLSEEHLHALKKDMRAQAEKYMEEISLVPVHTKSGRAGVGCFGRYFWQREERCWCNPSTTPSTQ